MITLHMQLAISTLKMEHSVIELRLVQRLITSRPMVITLQLVTEDSLPNKKVAIGLEDMKTDTYPIPYKPGAIQGDRPKGTLTSAVFKITGRYITFLLGGGCDFAWIRAELLVDYRVSIRCAISTMHAKFNSKWTSSS